MTVKSLEELAEVRPSVMRPGGSLGVVLHSKNRVFPVPHTFDSVVVEVKVGDP